MAKTMCTDADHVGKGEPLGAAAPNSASNVACIGSVLRIMVDMFVRWGRIPGP